MGDDLDDIEFEKRFRSLRAQYLAELPTRREALASLWAASRHDVASSAWHELQTLAHRLSGSAPCYGLDAMGEAAQELDRLLSGKPPCREQKLVHPSVAQLLALMDAAIAGNRVRARLS